MKNDKKEILVMGGLKHLSEREINKFIKEEPEITIKGYLLFLCEIADIEKATENARRKNNDN